MSYWDTPRLWACVDPGEDTGMSLLETVSMEAPPILLDTVTFAYQPELIYQRLTDWYWSQNDGVYSRYEDAFTLIGEKFVPRPGRAINYTALRVMGVYETWYYQRISGGNGVAYVQRMPVQGKKEVTNAELGLLGMLKTTHAERHVNDATRHGISWLIERGHRGTALVAKPKGEDD